MAFSICYWANYTQEKTKLSRKSVNAVADDRVLKFLYVMLNPQCDVTGNTRMVACKSKECKEWLNVNLG